MANPSSYPESRHTSCDVPPEQSLSESRLEQILDRLTNAGLATLLEWARHEAPGLLRMLMVSYIEGHRAQAVAQRPGAPRPARRDGSKPRSPSTDSLRNMEREHITRVVSESRTLTEAAARLGIHSTTLWRRLKHYNIRTR
jgi:transcriptional regulator of acetoin/glycerol metabolism